jgi:hypothetical protein
MNIPGSSSSSSGGGGGAILLIMLVLQAAARPPSTFNDPVDGWLLCAHSIVNHPHPCCLFPTLRPRRSPRARLCPVRTTTKADPPPEVVEDRPHNAPDVNAR